MNSGTRVTVMRWGLLSCVRVVSACVLSVRARGQCVCCQCVRVVRACVFSVRAYCQCVRVVGACVLSVRACCQSVRVVIACVLSACDCCQWVIVNKIVSVNVYNEKHIKVHNEYVVLWRMGVMNPLQQWCNLNIYVCLLPHVRLCQSCGWKRHGTFHRHHI